MKKINFLAYYLPQYHPIAENDEWWGKGFTEWRNVTKAKPLFKGHYQPILPADLGFYDLRVPEVREQQAELAKEYGIDGFIYYHYWFGNGKLLLEKPAKDMLICNKPDFPFCFCWANQTWKGIWHGLDNPNTLIEQKYLGIDDYINHFNYLLPFFKDLRYIKVDNKPMFHLYEPFSIPDLEVFINLFNKLAIENGFNGVYFVGNYLTNKNDFSKSLLNAVVGMESFFKMRYSNEYSKRKDVAFRLNKKITNGFRGLIGKKKVTYPQIYDYKVAVEILEKIEFPDNVVYFPCIIPNWDNSARSGNKSLIFKNATPSLWGSWIRSTIEKVKKQNQSEKFIVIKSWNEWAEGNYLEPDLKWGKEWLNEVLKARNTTEK